MNTFRFHRELDIPFLQEHFGDDPFSAREVFGSFVEMAEHELNILESAKEQRRFSAFARIASRLKQGLDAVGLKEERKKIDKLRSRYALEGVNEDFEKMAEEIIDSVRNKSGLLRIEVQRLDKYIESSAQ
jgi:HPt (histidine-containing phosphotransfer) domain-containing protein